MLPSRQVGAVLGVSMLVAVLGPDRIARRLPVRLVGDRWRVGALAALGMAAGAAAEPAPQLRAVAPVD